MTLFFYLKKLENYKKTKRKYVLIKRTAFIMYEEPSKLNMTNYSTKKMKKKLKTYHLKRYVDSK